MGATLALEYNKEVWDQISAAGAPPERYVGMTVTRVVGANNYVSSWQNGLVDWTEEEQLAGGSCSKYPAWFDLALGDLTNFYVYLDVSTDTLELGQTPAGGIPTHHVCQYQGKNLALNKPTYARGMHSTSGPSNAVVDGKWDGVTYYGNGYDWFTVDLQARFAIKRFMWRQRMDCCGSRNRDMTFLVGDELPPAGANPVDTAPYLTCGTFPYVQFMSKMDSVTCDCMPVGSVALVINVYHSVQMQLVELAVYGVPIGSFNQ